jgi:hypothetical protein
MSIKKITTAIILMMTTMSCLASSSVVWQGTKSFVSWSDVINISGSQFNGVSADDIIRFTISVESGAQLQLSHGPSWTNFDGLGSRDIHGDFDLIVTKSNISQLREGIHIKGVNFTLTAVTHLSHDGGYATDHPSLFAWDQLLVSGADKGTVCTLAMKPYSGVGWYWEAGVDMHELGAVDVELQFPAPEPVILQILYNTSNVKSTAIGKGEQKGSIKLTSLQKNVYSVNLLSEKEQTIALKSVNLKDKEGNTVTAIEETLSGNDDEIISTEYHTISGMRTSALQDGINVIIMKTKGGRVVTRKVIK